MTNLKELRSYLDMDEPANTDFRKALIWIKKNCFTEDQIKMVEDHTGRTFYTVSKALPFGSALAVATNGISAEDYVNHILAQPSNSKYKVPEERYVLGNDWPVTVREKAVDVLAAIDPDGESVSVPEVSSEELEKALKELNKVKTELKKKEEESKNLKKTLKAALKKEKTEEVEELEVHSGECVGTVTMTPVKKLFDGVLKTDIEVPVWSWTDEEGNPVKNPKVPEVDPNYIFRADEVNRVVYALVSNQRMYLHGHTGTGKTTLIEQVAAQLNWPTVRINFDSEITRMDLLGKVDMFSEGGTTVTKWQDGLLPQAMSSPTIAIFDEIDFCRPDVAYVMQAATEGNGMTLLEDNGRFVEPHPMFRMFATGNTVGQGDEYGMYQGARAQSLAFLDRFTIWMKVDYLSKKSRTKLLKDTCPALPEEVTKKISDYVTEHLQAFTSANVLQPISPRGMLAVGKAAEYLILNTDKDASECVAEALKMVVLDRATQEDGAVLKGIAQRVL